MRPPPIEVFEVVDKLPMFGELHHDVEHDELRRCHNGFPLEVLMEYLSWVHPPEI